MIVEAINKIIALATPNTLDVGKLKYTDKELTVIAPPIPSTMECSTLQGLVDLLDGGLEGAAEGDDLFVVIESPTAVELVEKDSDDYGRRQVIVRAEYPKDVKLFPFNQWLNPESFIIAALSNFQRVKIENDDGSFAKDLDYVIQIASKITADSTVDHEDDGITQRVAVKQGVTLKTDVALRGRVLLAPWRTFAEVDQVLSTFVFRTRVQGDQPQLALFEGDGGRWKIDAVANIKAWLAKQITKSPIIS